MFSRVSNSFLDWFNRTETPSDHQGSTNGDQSGANLKEYKNKENMQFEKEGINEDSNAILNQQEGENEGKIESEKAFGVAREGEQEKGNISKLLASPKAEDALSTLPTGSCEFEMNCKANQCHNSQPQVFKVNGKEESVHDGTTQELKEKDDGQAEQIHCKHLDYHGEHTYGVVCDFNDKGITSAVELNFMGLPIRRGEADCPYYMLHGSCKFEANCKFNHPDPTSVVESDNLSEHSNEGSTLSSDTSQSWPPGIERLPNAYLTFSSTQDTPSHPEWTDFQVPIYPPGSSIQLAPGCATYSQPLERNFYTHEQQQMLVDEFPERPGQPECSYFLKFGTCKHRSACKFHHPKSDSAKLTLSALWDSCVPLTSDMQPLLQEAVASPSSDSSFTKKCAGQNLVSNVDKSKLKQNEKVSMKKGANQKVKCDLCKVEFIGIQAYNNHLYGKKHAKNLEKFHALRVMPQARKASPSINTRCTGNEMGIRSGKGCSAITSLVNNFDANQLNLCSAAESGIPGPSQKPRCDLCKVEFTSIQLYKNHLYGKKHAKSQEKFLAMRINSPAEQASKSVYMNFSANEISTPSGKSVTGVSTVVTDVEKKKLKLLKGGVAVQSLRVCTICNVVCNGDVAFADHLAGMKHLAQVQAPAIIVDPSTTTGTNPKPKVSEEISKKTNNVKSAWCCEVCKVSCTSFEDLKSHKKGKKHKFNIQISKSPKTDSSNHASMSAQPPLAQSKESNDVEVKKKKVLECGAAADAVRICSICNVVCNSLTVFNSHLAGQKHASTVRQKEAGNIS